MVHKVSSNWYMATNEIINKSNLRQNEQDSFRFSFCFGFSTFCAIFSQISMTQPKQLIGKKRKFKSDDEYLMQPKLKQQKIYAEKKEVENNSLSLIGDVMSPRMLYRLQTLSETACDMALDMANNYGIENAAFNQYLPNRFRKHMSNNFWNGYCQCFDAIYAILQAKKLPSIEAVRTELNRSRYNSIYTLSYLNNGGLIEYPLDAIISRSKEESCDDESFFEIPSHVQQHNALPEMKEYDFDYDTLREILLENDCSLDFDLEQ
eukprot:403458_1